MIDVCRLLGEDRRFVKSRTHGDHQLESLGDCRECGGGRPGLERIGVDPLDVVHEQLGDQRDVVADLFAALRQPLHVFPGRAHAFVRNVAKPAAEDGKPVSISHQAAPPAAAAAAPAAAASPPERDERLTRPTR